MNHQEQWMQRSLDLAKRGSGRTAPNPMVGCVVVKDDRIIAEGWHQQYGGLHAEAEALHNFADGGLPGDAVVYVSLEPCAHHGKTPPCADLLIRKGARKVVVAMRDPFAKVNGKGIDKLKHAGIEVTENVLNEAASHLNRRFMAAQKYQRPFVILKWAETADGFIAAEDRSRVQISGHAATLLLHRWRSEEAAILVGRGTLQYDNPLLNNRYWNSGLQPLRIILDPDLKGSMDSRVFSDSASLVWVMNTRRNETIGHVRYIAAEKDKFLPELMNALQAAGKQSLLVEGGPETLQRFYQAGIADELRIIRSKIFYLGKGIPAPNFGGTLVESGDTGEDEWEIFRV
jgi:diaminohydroxyphosphoribosylaminopyrimidine deaminase / 5-amino-6-(5-phosphoribosylamino)uracil reductase